MKLEFKNNSFGILRLVAALIVMLSHSFRWFGIEKPVALMFLTDGATGVIIFFAMTGYLIMGAYERILDSGGKWINFIINRILRLYPALIVSFVLISLINICLLKLNIFEVGYIKYAIVYLLAGNGAGYLGRGISNGVLWTIPVDVIFYMLTPIIYVVGKRMSVKLWCLVIIIAWQFNLWDEHILLLLQKIPYIGSYFGATSFVFFAYEFLIGVFLYFYRDTIVAFFSQKKVLFIWFSIYLIWFWLLRYSGIIEPFGLMHNPIQGILVAPFAIFLAYGMGKKQLKIDISYGIFLYHMVTVGILLHFNVTGWTGIILTISITPLLALLSYIFIENPMLRRKIKKQI